MLTINWLFFYIFVFTRKSTAENKEAASDSSKVAYAYSNSIINIL